MGKNGRNLWISHPSQHEWENDVQYLHLSALTHFIVISAFPCASVAATLQSSFIWKETEERFLLSWLRDRLEMQGRSTYLQRLQNQKAAAESSVVVLHWKQDCPCTGALALEWDPRKWAPCNHRCLRLTPNQGVLHVAKNGLYLAKQHTNPNKKLILSVSWKELKYWSTSLVSCE